MQVPDPEFRIGTYQVRVRGFSTLGVKPVPAGCWLSPHSTGCVGAPMESKQRGGGLLTARGTELKTSPLFCRSFSDLGANVFPFKKLSMLGDQNIW